MNGSYPHLSQAAFILTSSAEAIRNIITDRLLGLGLEKIRLPLGAEAHDPHLPIFVSSDIEKKKHVVILFYEHTQDLGVFAHRIIGGKGGINQGSAINLVKYIQSQCFSTSNVDSPGIILANMGQLRWWRHGQKACTQTSWFALPQKSAVDPPYRFDPEKNSIPGNTTTYEHASTNFNSVVEKLAHPDAKLYIIGVSDGAVQVSTFLDKEDNFSKWGPRVSAFAAVATYFHAHEIHNKHFAKWFLARGRVYTQSQEPAGIFMADKQGGKNIPAFGALVFSSGEPYYSETMIPQAHKVIIDWFKEVAADPEYENPKLERFDDESEEEDTLAWGGEADGSEDNPWTRGESMVKEIGDSEVGGKTKR